MGERVSQLGICCQLTAVVGKEPGGSVVNNLTSARTRRGLKVCARKHSTPSCSKTNTSAQLRGCVCGLSRQLRLLTPAQNTARSPIVAQKSTTHSLYKNYCVRQFYFELANTPCNELQLYRGLANKNHEPKTRRHYTDSKWIARRYASAHRIA